MLELLNVALFRGKFAVMSIFVLPYVSKSHSIKYLSANVVPNSILYCGSILSILMALDDVLEVCLLAMRDASLPSVCSSDGDFMPRIHAPAVTLN